MYVHYLLIEQWMYTCTCTSQFEFESSGMYKYMNDRGTGSVLAQKMEPLVCPVLMQHVLYMYSVLLQYFLCYIYSDTTQLICYVSDVTLVIWRNITKSQYDVKMRSTGKTIAIQDGYLQFHFRSSDHIYKKSVCLLIYMMKKYSRSLLI